MWQPIERIRYQSTQGLVPTAEQAASSALYQSIALGSLQLSNRIWVPAMVPWRSNEEGDVTPDVIDWYARFARGQPGAIVMEATGIRDVPSGPLLRLSHDRYINGLSRLVDAVREASGGKTRLLIQLIDFLRIRRRPSPDVFFRRHLVLTRQLLIRAGIDTATPPEDAREALLDLGPDRWPEVLNASDYRDLQYGARESVNDTHLAHIASLPHELPELFAQAALRAKQAGLDGVELHYAHAYTMASFLSATNCRTDGYGGSPEGRLKVPLAVLAAVRERVGHDFTVGCRMLTEECIEGGTTLEESCQYAKALAAAGMDFISTSRGGKFDDAKQPAVGQAAYPYTGRSGYECMPSRISDALGPFGRNLGATHALRQTLRAHGLQQPVVGVGGIHNFEQAQTAIDQEVCDIVGMARQSLADPDWPRKIRDGHGASVQVCEYTNYCEGLDQKHKQVTCQLWDRRDLNDPSVKRTHDGKRRLIAPDWSPTDTKSVNPAH
ncbi:MAG: NADH:flavin oxidoreductase [Burkholderiaceae bacterium]